MSVKKNSCNMCWHFVEVINLSLNLKSFDTNATLLLNILQHIPTTFKIELIYMLNRLQKESLCKLTQAHDNMWYGEYDKRTWRLFSSGQ